ncbi:hypothetical protein CPB83DRAFT_753499 [Crepidotus variabilis]|uniref:F-box domain-containing protein n=1 Tax=Crepidotus variabilis TaxID=179855 RepID=A0A9P6JVQ3_9AGAR|nr:hypothetical protein CPB83DRAFT_753499 [Crepidotus variabilis]
MVTKPVKDISRVNAPHLPLELVLAVVEFACSQGTDEENTSLLSACSTVCRAWSPSMQKLLFSRVILRSQPSFQLFINAIDRTTTHGQMLADSVKWMRVVLDHNQPLSLHHHSFALAVSACSNLEELHIASYGCPEPGKDVVGVPDVSRLRRLAPSFDDQAISLLKSGPQIKSLHFKNWSENQETVFQLLEVWPSLEHLSLGGTTPRLSQETRLPFPCSLHSLSLNFQSTPSVEFLRWLLHNSAASLRRVRCERDLSRQAFEYLMEDFGSQLDSLRMPGSISPEFVKMVSSCRHLRQLYTENPAIPCANGVPKELEHLAFGLDYDTPLHSIIDLVRKSETLKTINAMVWEGGHKHRFLSPLKMACAYRGVDLVLTTNLAAFRQCV